MCIGGDISRLWRDDTDWQSASVVSPKGRDQEKEAEYALAAMLPAALAMWEACKEDPGDV